MATNETFRVVGYDHHRYDSAGWVTDQGPLTRRPEEAAEFGSYIEAERRAAELFAAQHLGLSWMPVQAITPIEDVQSDHRKPWRETTPG